MIFCACKCDNVTTCDNLVFLGCHAVTSCFLSLCDNVTLKTPRTRIHAHARIHENTLSHMSQCHINIEINHLGCDNLAESRCHVVTGFRLWGFCGCVGGKLIITTWFLMLVIRSLGLFGMVGFGGTVLGRQTTSKSADIQNASLDYLVVLMPHKMRLTYANKTSKGSQRKKVLPSFIQYGSQSRAFFL